MAYNLIKNGLTYSIQGALTVNGVVTADGFTGTPFDLTAASLQTLKSTNSLVVGKVYRVTDYRINSTNNATEQIIVRAVSTNAFEEKCLIETDVPDWQLDYAGQLGIWRSTLTPAIGEIVIWNLQHWENLTGAVGTEPDGDAVNWLNVPIPDSSYIHIYLDADYNSDNGSTNFVYDQFNNKMPSWQLDYYPINRAQFYNNKINTDGSYVGLLNAGVSAVFRENTFDNGTFDGDRLNGQFHSNFVQSGSTVFLAGDNTSVFFRSSIIRGFSYAHSSNAPVSFNIESSVIEMNADVGQSANGSTVGIMRSRFSSCTFSVGANATSVCNITRVNVLNSSIAINVDGCTWDTVEFFRCSSILFTVSATNLTDCRFTRYNVSFAPTATLNVQGFFAYGNNISQTITGTAGIFRRALTLTGFTDVSANYTVSPSDQALYCTGTITITLPSIGSGAGLGRELFIVNTDGLTKTIDGDGAELVGGSATQTIVTANGTMTVVGNVIDWSIKARYLT